MLIKEVESAKKGAFYISTFHYLLNESVIVGSKGCHENGQIGTLLPIKGERVGVQPVEERALETLLGPLNT